LSAGDVSAAVASAAVTRLLRVHANPVPAVQTPARRAAELPLPPIPWAREACRGTDDTDTVGGEAGVTLNNSVSLRSQ
jgi:hypothetical protein